jgi:hypothetical protein
MSHTVADLTAFALRLENAGLADYRLTVRGRNAVTFDVHVADEVWSIDFLVDGSIVVEVFSSGWNNHGAQKVEDLFARHGKT